MLLILTLLFLYCFVTKFTVLYPLVIFTIALYYGRYYYDGGERNGKRRSPRVRKWIGSLIRFLQQYLWPHRLEYHGPLTETQAMCYLGVHKGRPAIFSSERHLIFSIGLYFLLLGTQSWKRIFIGQRSYLFSIPFLRDFLLWLGMMDGRLDNGAGLETGRPVCTVVDNFVLEYAWEKKIPVFPIIQRGEERIWRHWRNDWIERNLWPHTIAWIGLPFLYFFYLRKGEIVSHVFPPLVPEDFFCSENFIDIYRKTMEKHNVELNKLK